MFEKYIDYNQIAEAMIRSREDNLAALSSLREQYMELEQSGGLKGVTFHNDRVQGGGITDTVANLAIRKESLSSQIDSLDRERQLYDRAWARLKEDEQQVLEVFFQQGMKKQDAIDLLCERYEREPATIYRRKDAALKRFKKLLFG